MKKLLKEDELRKEYDVYRLREIANEGIGLENLLKIADGVSKKGVIDSYESCGYYKSFEDWLKENKKIDMKKEITIAEILEDRRIDIDMCTRNVTQYYEINIDSITLPFDKDYLDLYLDETIYSEIERYDVKENGIFIKESISEEELREYLQELYNEYN